MEKNLSTQNNLDTQLKLITEHQESLHLHFLHSLL